MLGTRRVHTVHHTRSHIVNGPQYVNGKPGVLLHRLSNQQAGWKDARRMVEEEVVEGN